MLISGTSFGSVISICFFEYIYKTYEISSILCLGVFGRRPNNKMNKLKFVTISIIMLLLLSMASPSMNVFAGPLAAASDPGLGTAASASILATTGVTNSGTSSTNADVDVSPFSQVQPVGLLVGGAFHSADGVAAGVLADATAAGLNILGQPLTSNQGPALDGLTLVSGVYDIGAGRLNGGVLTLNGPGVYIFRASSDFVTSGTVSLINGARACDVYWRVDSLATINGSSFVGTIIAGTGVHFGDSVTLDGRALAINGDVTLLNDTITGPTCAVAPTAVAPTAVPEETTTTNNNTTTKVKALPNTGGAPIRDDSFPWSLALIGGIGTVALVLGVRKYLRTNKQ
jgi:hypothetical protein